jgi:hypothetical protein
MRKLTLSLRNCALIAATLFLTNCQKEDNSALLEDQSAAKAAAAEGKKYSIMTNGEDPLLMKIEGGGGKTTSLYGTRDENGLPCTLDAILETQGSETTKIFFDLKGRPLKLIASNGVKIQYEWVGSKTANITAVSADGKTQVNTSIDFTSATTISKTTEKVNTTLKKQAFKPRGPFIASAEKKAAALATPVPWYNGLVNLEKCGTPFSSDDISVMLEADNISDQIPVYYGLETGKYAFRYPRSNDLIVSSCDAALKIKDLLMLVCASKAYINETVTVVNLILVSSGVDTDVLATFTIAGSDAERILNSICLIADAGILGCEDFGVARLFNNIKLTPVVDGVKGTTVAAAPGGALTALNFTLPAQAEIKSFVLVPPNPPEGVSYTAIADIYCLPAGSVVTLSIVGTDGYTNSISYTTTGTSSDNSYILEVPGAEAAVRDVVTVRVTLPAGSLLESTAYLVFGN